MCNPFFDQDEIETHTSTEEEYKPPEKARSVPIALYPDQEADLDRLTKKMATLTRTRLNKSVTARALIKYAIDHFEEHEDELIACYLKSKSR